jgi:hypothetical protein
VPYTTVTFAKLSDATPIKPTATKPIKKILSSFIFPPPFVVVDDSNDSQLSRLDQWDYLLLLYEM